MNMGQGYDISNFNVARCKMINVKSLDFCIDCETRIERAT